jgi:hypothetical protein
MLFEHAGGFHLKADDVVLALNPRPFDGGDLQLIAAGDIPEVYLWMVMGSSGAVATFRA